MGGKVDVTPLACNCCIDFAAAGGTVVANFVSWTHFIKDLVAQMGLVNSLNRQRPGWYVVGHRLRHELICRLFQTLPFTVVLCRKIGPDHERQTETVPNNQLHRPSGLHIRL